MRAAQKITWSFGKGSRNSWHFSRQLCAPVQSIRPPLLRQSQTSRLICLGRGTAIGALRAVSPTGIPSAGISTSGGQVTAAPGLYGVPGLHTPDDLLSLATRIVMYCQELQIRLMLLGESAAAVVEVEAAEEEAALVRSHHEVVSWLKQPAEHCARHHVEGRWREAAGRAVRAMQAVEGLLAQKLAARPRWNPLAEPGHELKAEPGPEVEPEGVQHLASILAADEVAAVATPSATASVAAASLITESACGGGAGADSACSVNASASLGPQKQDGAAGVQGGGPGVNDAAASAAAPPRRDDTGGLRLVSEAVSRAVCLTEEDRQERRELEELERRLVAAYRAALADPRVAPVPLVMLHDSEVRGDPLLARNVTPATETEVAAARARPCVALPLVLLPEPGEEVQKAEGSAARDGAAVEAAAAEETPVVEVELGPVAAATPRALTRGGRLWTLRLTGPLTLLLLSEHPSTALRRAVHAVTHGSQAAAALRFMDVLRPLRDNLADCLNQPSYAHLKMEGSVAGDPRVALALLGDILSAVRPLADREVEAMQELQMRLLLEGEDEDLKGAPDGGADAGLESYDPLDLRGSIDFLTALQRPLPLGADEWRELALYFTVEGVLQGLSRQLSHVFGLELVSTPPGSPSELWHPGSVVRLEMRKAAASRPGPGSGSGLGSRHSHCSASSTSRGGNSGQLLGVLYVHLDPECDLPYAVLVRHGYGGYGEAPSAPWLMPEETGADLGDQTRSKHPSPDASAAARGPGPGDLESRPVSSTPKKAAADAMVTGDSSATTAAPPHDSSRNSSRSGACRPHVALHLPAGQVTRGSGGYLVPEHPGLIRTLAHELGHALHFLLSYSPGSLPDSNACYSSTDYLELASHILERWAADMRVLSNISCHALSGARLPQRRCAAVAATPLRQPTWLELQQHTLAATADLLLHLNGHVDLQRLRLVPQTPTATSPQPPPSPGEERTVTVHGLLELQSTPALELVSALWAEHSSLPGGAFQPSRGLMSVLPGLLHNAGAMYAYPAAQLVAAAVWERHFAPPGEGLEEEEEEEWERDGGEEGLGVLGSAAAVRGGQLLRQTLLQVGDPAAAAGALEALLGDGCVRRVRLARPGSEIAEGAGDGVCDMTDLIGVIPDLAHESFQGVDPLVF